MRRLGALWVLVPMYLLASHTRVRACDDLVATLISGKDRVTEFDRAMEAIATHLRRTIRGAKEGDWREPDQEYDRLLVVWLGVYQKFLTRPPEGFGDHPDWSGLLTAASKRFRDLGDRLKERKFEPFHEAVLEAHACLMKMYLRPGSTAEAKALEAVSEPVDLVLGTRARGIQRDSLKLRLETATTRLEMFRPLVTDPALRVLADEIKTRCARVVEKAPGMDEGKLVTEVTAILERCTRFRDGFPRQK